jgi:hypothetical protein
MASNRLRRSTASRKSASGLLRGDIENIDALTREFVRPSGFEPETCGRARALLARAQDVVRDRESRA